MKLNGHRPSLTNSEHFVVPSVNASSPTSTLSHESTSSTSSSSSPNLRMRSLDYEFSNRDLIMCNELPAQLKSPSLNDNKHITFGQTTSPNDLLILDRENLAQINFLNRRKSNESSSTEGSVSSTTFSNLLNAQTTASILPSNRMTSSDSGKISKRF